MLKITKGRAGIGDSSRSGRPVKVDDHVIAQSLDTIINDAQTGNAAIPSVKELSETLHAPEAKIRSYLKEKGIIQSRQNVWQFLTSKGFTARWIDIVGLYLSPDQQVIIVRTCMDSAGQFMSGGKLVVRNRKQAAEIQNATDQEGYIGLTKALEIFNRFPEKTASMRTENALQFVRAVISGFPSSLSGVEYHLIVCGKQMIESGRTLIPGAYISKTAAPKSLTHRKSPVNPVCLFLPVRSVSTRLRCRRAGLACTGMIRRCSPIVICLCTA